MVPSRCQKLQLGTAHQAANLGKWFMKGLSKRLLLLIRVLYSSKKKKASPEIINVILMA